MVRIYICQTLLTRMTAKRARALSYKWINTKEGAGGKCRLSLGYPKHVYLEHDTRRRTRRKTSGRGRARPRTARARRSIEIGLELSAVAETAASTAGGAVVEAVLRTGLRGGVAVLELVARHANVAVRADEDAALHVADAGGADDAHLVALHVGLAADVDDAHRAEGVLAPRVGDLAVEHGGVAMDGRPGARLARGEADGGAGAVGDGGGDERLYDVDPRPLRAPDDEHDVLAGLIAEFVCVGPVVAEPDALVRAVAIDAERFEAHLRHELDRVAVRQRAVSLEDGAVFGVLGRVYLPLKWLTCSGRLDLPFDVERLGFFLRVEVGMFEGAGEHWANGDGGQHQSSGWVTHILVSL